MASLNFADLDGLFFSISLFVGLIILLVYFSNKAVLLVSSSGRYLEGFDLFFEKLLKKILQFYPRLNES